VDEKTVIGAIHLAATATIKPEGMGPSSFVTPVDGKIVAEFLEDADEDSHAEDAGTFRLLHISLGELEDEGVALYTVCDDYGNDLWEVFAALFRKDGRIKRELHLGKPPRTNLLYIESASVRPKYVESSLLVQAIETAVAKLCHSGLVVADVGLGLGQRQWKGLGGTRRRVRVGQQQFSGARTRSRSVRLDNLLATQLARLPG
jgi:hypothetical protein